MSEKFTYHIDFEQDDEDDWFAKMRELDGLMTHAKTPELALRNFGEVTEMFLDSMIHSKEQIPRPGSRISTHAYRATAQQVKIGVTVSRFFREHEILPQDALEPLFCVIWGLSTGDIRQQMTVEQVTLTLDLMTCLKEHDFESGPDTVMGLLYAASVIKKFVVDKQGESR